MTHQDVLFKLLMQLMRMRTQTYNPASEIDLEFFWQESNQFHFDLDRYTFDLSILSYKEYRVLHEIHNEVKDFLEVATRELYPDRRPLFFSRAFRNAEKDAQGYPLKPVQLRGLLEQEIFADLPAVVEYRQEAEQVQDAAQEQPQQSSAGLPAGTGSAHAVAAQEQPSQQSSAGLPAGTGSAHAVAAPSGPVSVRGVLVPVVTEISLLARRPINLKLEAYP